MYQIRYFSQIFFPRPVSVHSTLLGFPFLIFFHTSLSRTVFGSLPLRHLLGLAFRSPVIWHSFLTFSPFAVFGTYIHFRWFQVKENNT